MKDRAKEIIERLRTTLDLKLNKGHDRDIIYANIVDGLAMLNDNSYSQLRDEKEYLKPHQVSEVSRIIEGLTGVLLRQYQRESDFNNGIRSKTDPWN